MENINHLDLILNHNNLKEDQSKFSDSDGLISFVNLTNEIIGKSNEYKPGRELCDKICNFYSSLRIKVYTYLKDHPEAVLPGDTPPTSQWSKSVTHYMEYILVEAGGLAGFKIKNESYSSKQAVAEFSTDIFKMIFDAVTFPEALITDITNFIKGVGKTLRTCWEKKEKNFEVALMSQCHEGINTGKDLIYFPKVKYYYISVSATQTEFTNDCSKTQYVTFNFNFESRVSALKASVLDTKASDYTKFKAALDKAQGKLYTDCLNTIDKILDTESKLPAGEFLLDTNINLDNYPRISRS